MPGQKVKRGEKIGEVGNTGLSKGPHLHYEVIYRGVHVDPINYLSRDMTEAEFARSSNRRSTRLTKAINPMDNKRTPKFKELVPRWHEQRAKFKKKFWRGSHPCVRVDRDGRPLLRRLLVLFRHAGGVPDEITRRALLRQRIRVAGAKRYDDGTRKCCSNVVERDRQVFRTLFESDPYSFDNGITERRNWRAHEELLTEDPTGNWARTCSSASSIPSKRRAGDQLYTAGRPWNKHADSAERPSRQLYPGDPAGHQQRSDAADRLVRHADPPVRQNPDRPPGRGLHGQRRVRAFSRRPTAGSSRRRHAAAPRPGNTVVINHGNGYETSYSHLGKIYAQTGPKSSRRGDIIAQSGNSGPVAGAPHLHYEVMHNGMRVDPVHYFFHGTRTTKDYRKIIRIAQSGMQSFD